MTTKGNGKDRAPVEVQTDCPPDWGMAMDTEPPIRAALGLCQRFGISLSGSTWEKKARAARRLSFEVHRLGGSVTTDQEKAGACAYQITALADRKAALTAMHQLTPEKAADLDGQIKAVQRNLDGHQKRVDQLSGVVHQGQRQAKVAELRRVMSEVGAQIDRYKNVGMPTPPELDDQFDGLCIGMDKAEAEFAAGTAELDRLNAEMGAAEAEARHGLATTIRDRVLEVIAEKVRAAMPDKEVTLAARMPGRPRPPEVAAALREAQSICAVADRLAGETSGFYHFARVLPEGIRAVLFPTFAADLPRRRRGPSPDALMNQTF